MLLPSPLFSQSAPELVSAKGTRTQDNVQRWAWEMVAQLPTFVERKESGVSGSREGLPGAVRAGSEEKQLLQGEDI